MAPARQGKGRIFLIQNRKKEIGLVFFYCEGRPNVTSILVWKPLKLALSLAFSSNLRWFRLEYNECGDSSHESH